MSSGYHVDIAPVSSASIDAGYVCHASGSRLTNDERDDAASANSDFHPGDRDTASAHVHASSYRDGCFVL